MKISSNNSTCAVTKVTDTNGIRKIDCALLRLLRIRILRM